MALKIFNDQINNNTNIQTQNIIPIYKTIPNVNTVAEGTLFLDNTIDTCFYKSKDQLFSLLSGGNFSFNNIGIGTGLIFKNITLNVVNLRTLLSGQNIDILTGINEITIGTTNDIVIPGTSTFNGISTFNAASTFNGTTTFNAPSTFYWQNTIFGPTTVNSFYINNPTTTPTPLNANTIIGGQAGQNLASSAVNVTLFGSKAGQNLTTGSSSTVIGSAAAQFATTANITAVGNAALQVATGTGNTAVGQAAGRFITSGVNNICLGFFSGAGITTGTSNIVISANNANALTTGNRCVIIGSGVSIPITTASDVVCVGNGSGTNGATGDSCTYLGRQAGQATVSGFTHSTALGADARFTSSNQIQLGQNNVDDVVTGRDLTITRNASISALNGIRYTGTMTSTGATPRTLNTINGFVSFTGIASIAAGGNTNLVINNSLVTIATVGQVVSQGGTFTAQSNPIIKKVTFGAGTITINVENESSATATGAGGVLNYTFTLWQL